MDMDYSVRAGERGVLVETLRQFERDRGERGESERAAEARRAADLLEQGSDGAYFDRVIYAVGAAGRWTAFGGDRGEVLRELREAEVGFEHGGKSILAADARIAQELVAGGAEDVHVGHLLYVVRP